MCSSLQVCYTGISLLRTLCYCLSLTACVACQCLISAGIGRSGTFVMVDSVLKEVMTFLQKSSNMTTFCKFLPQLPNELFVSDRQTKTKSINTVKHCSIVKEEHIFRWMTLKFKIYSGLFAFINFSLLIIKI